MSAKAVLVFCAQALLVQIAFTQYIAGPAAPLGIAGWNGLGAGCGCGGVASTGGGLPVSSASPCAPVGVSVLSENSYAGNLCAGGNLPFLGSVGIEGVLPTAGAGAVSYGCGNGAIGIVSEGPIATGILAPTDFAPAAGLINGIGLGGIAGIGGIDGFGLAGIDGYGLGLGYGINGLGCGGIY